MAGLFFFQLRAWITCAPSPDGRFRRRASGRRVLLLRRRRSGGRLRRRSWRRCGSLSFRRWAAVQRRPLLRRRRRRLGTTLRRPRLSRRICRLRQRRHRRECHERNCYIKRRAKATCHHSSPSSKTTSVYFLMGNLGANPEKELESAVCGHFQRIFRHQESADLSST